MLYRLWAVASPILLRGKLFSDTCCLSSSTTLGPVKTFRPNHVIWKTIISDKHSWNIQTKNTQNTCLCQCSICSYSSNAHKQCEHTHYVVIEILNWIFVITSWMQVQIQRREITTWLHGLNCVLPSVQDTTFRLNRVMTFLYRCDDLLTY